MSDFLKADLSQFFFFAKTLGIKNVCDIDLLTVYDRTRLELAAEYLYSMGLLNERGELTVLGRVVSALPLDLPLGVALVTSFEKKFTCSREVLVIGKFV